MRRTELAHVLRASAAISNENIFGSLSTFHDTFGYHADGVGPETAHLPMDWMERAVLRYIDDVTAICPELHDLTVSKCVAGREKDAEFVRVLFRNKLIDLDTVLERIAALDASKNQITHITQWARLRAREAGHV